MRRFFSETKVASAERKENIIEYKLYNLNNAHQAIKSKYKQYLREYKSENLRHSQSREDRDREFEKLLGIFETCTSEELSQAFYKICQFFLDQKDTGRFHSTPELIRYIRLSLYPIFGLNNDFSMNYYCTVFGRAYQLPPNFEINETDYLKKALYKELEKFCQHHKSKMTPVIMLELGSA